MFGFFYFGQSYFAQGMPVAETPVPPTPPVPPVPPEQPSFGDVVPWMSRRDRNSDGWSQFPTASKRSENSFQEALNRTRAEIEDDDAEIAWLVQRALEIIK